MTLSVAQLTNALTIRTKIDKLESIITRLHKQLEAILGGDTVKAVKPKAVQQKRRQYRKIKEKAWPKIEPVNNEGGTLKEALIKVLAQAGKPLHINDILKGLKAGGHKTAAKDIKKQVGVRLYTSKEFLKTAPGTFTLKAIGAKVPKKASKAIAKKSPAKGKRTKKALPFPRV